IMTPIAIVMFVFGGIALLIGLLLSGSGTGAGLNAQAGQDLELFKKTKDRGFVKILQIVMFVITLVLLGLGIALLFIK
ncbi:MAG: preprotein translocase subunit SecG, partial [Mycoplasmoidaceae bacterium]|nr:preprotein translocase subunit SecG [Mycoplasmoidaceae bacterium]